MPGTWTYDPTLFNSTTVGQYATSTMGVRYQVRFLIQDTQTARQLMFDEEIDWVQTQEMNAYMMAARCCDELVAKYGNVAMKKIGDLSITYGKFYAELAASLRSRGEGYQTPYAGGISLADKLAQEADPDWIAPRAFRGEFDNAGANQPTPDATNPLNWPSGGL